MDETAGADGGTQAVTKSRAYRWLIGSLRLAWLSCAAAVAAMVLALMLRSPELAAVFRLGLLVAATAVGCALLLFLLILGRRASYPTTGPLAARNRVEVLVASLLADLLDPAYR
ncbi:MAG: hypothetical protein M3P48_03055 [Actinomycetota bacterium]|nr:hypothetical protein [Actinomycetota bacterium]